MEDKLHIACSGFYSLRITQITLHDFQVAPESRQVFAFPGRKIIKYSDGRTFAQEFLYNMGTNEAGSTGDESTHPATFLETQLLGSMYVELFEYP